MQSCLNRPQQTHIICVSRVNETVFFLRNGGVGMYEDGWRGRKGEQHRKKYIIWSTVNPDPRRLNASVDSANLLFC